MTQTGDIIQHKVFLSLNNLRPSIIQKAADCCFCACLICYMDKNIKEREREDGSATH